MRILLVAAALVAPALAHADQCALNDAKVNGNATQLVTVGARVLELCEPCRERTPGKPYVVKSIEVKAREVFINGKGQDLAYLYVERGKDEFKNVGALAGCGPQFVSLTVRDGKPSGVGKSPPLPARPLPPGVPGSPPPPNMPRVSSAGELVGTWNVKLTTWLTTCPGKAPADQTWDVAIANGAFSITTSEGLVLEGPASSLTYGTFQHTFAARQHPSSMTLKLSHAMRDRFYGTLIVGTPTGNPSDPVCVSQVNVGGARKP